METEMLGLDQKPDRDLQNSTEKPRKTCRHYAKRFCIKDTVQKMLVLVWAIFKITSRVVKSTPKSTKI